MSDFHDIFILSIKNAKRVFFKIRLSMPTKTILEGILFMYVSKNTNISGIQFFTIKNNFVLSIEDTVSAKSDVNGQRDHSACDIKALQVDNSPVHTGLSTI